MSNSQLVVTMTRKILKNYKGPFNPKKICTFGQKWGRILVPTFFKISCFLLRFAENCVAKARKKCF